jgi:hypothetical protein
MKATTKKAVKQAMIKLQEAINIFKKVKGEDAEIDVTAEDLLFTLADLDYILRHYG